MFMLIFGSMAMGLNIVIGFAGLLDLGYVAFYAIGAYTAAFCVAPLGGGHRPVLHVRPVPGIFRSGSSSSAQRSSPRLRRRCSGADPPAARRLSGHRDPRLRRDRADRLQEPENVNFELGPIKLENANLTGGPLGINPIDAPASSIKFGVATDRRRSTSAVHRDHRRIVSPATWSSRMGRAWMAIREDEIGGGDDGRQHRPTKLLAFALGGQLRRLRRVPCRPPTRARPRRTSSVLDLDPGRDHDHPRRDGNIWGVAIGAFIV